MFLFELIGQQPEPASDDAQFISARNSWIQFATTSGLRPAWAWSYGGAGPCMWTLVLSRWQNHKYQPKASKID